MYGRRDRWCRECRRDNRNAITRMSFGNRFKWLHDHSSIRAEALRGPLPRQMPRIRWGSLLPIALMRPPQPCRFILRRSLNHRRPSGPGDAPPKVKAQNETPPHSGTCQTLARQVNARRDRGKLSSLTCGLRAKVHCTRIRLGRDGTLENTLAPAVHRISVGPIGDGLGQAGPRVVPAQHILRPRPSSPLSSGRMWGPRGPSRPSSL